MGRTCSKQDTLRSRDWVVGGLSLGLTDWQETSSHRHELLPLASHSRAFCRCRPDPEAFISERLACVDIPYWRAEALDRCWEPAVPT